MSDIAIRVDNLSKLYHLGAVHQRPDTLRDALTGLFRRGHQSTSPQSTNLDDLWALKEVSFEVKRGEVVGTSALASGASVPSTRLRTSIGRDGVGKITLLKILSCITEPTSGYAEIHGRVGSLLEVGHVSAQALMVVNYGYIRNRRVARLTCGKTWSSSLRSTIWRDLSTG